VLLDATGGCQGLTRQLSAACRWIDAERIHLVDVGGDALGRPGDPGLRTPMADVSTVVATRRTGLPAELTVFGAGADGELATVRVRERLAQLAAHRRATLTPEVAREHLPLLDWNPSEANAIVIAATLGVRGTVEMRDQGLPVHLDAGHAEAWTIALDQALPPAALTEAIERTRDAGQLRAAFTDAYGMDEIGYEEGKAERLAADPKLDAPVDARAVETVLAAAAMRGTDWFTRRRLKEALHPAQPTNDELASIVGDLWRPPLVATGRAGAGG
jgi:hypothetical protein